MVPFAVCIVNVLSTVPSALNRASVLPPYTIKSFPFEYGLMIVTLLVTVPCEYVVNTCDPPSFIRYALLFRRSIVCPVVIPEASDAGA